jgi:hypothetical protein
MVQTFEGPICSGPESIVREVGTTLDELPAGSYVLEVLINGHAAYPDSSFTVQPDPNGPPQYQGVGFVDVDLAGADVARIQAVALSRGADRVQQTIGQSGQLVLRLWVEPLRPTRRDANAATDQIMNDLVGRLIQEGVAARNIYTLRTDAIPVGR